MNLFSAEWLPSVPIFVGRVCLFALLEAEGPSEDGAQHWRAGGGDGEVELDAGFVC